MYTLQDLTHDELIEFTEGLVGELEIHKHFMNERELLDEELRVERQDYEDEPDMWHKRQDRFSLGVLMNNKMLKFQLAEI